MPAAEFPWRASHFALEKFDEISRFVEADLLGNMRDRQGRLHQQALGFQIDSGGDIGFGADAGDIEG